MKYSASTTSNQGMPVWYQDVEETLHKSLGRELIENLIKQEVLLYKMDIENTETNFYGESKRKNWLGPYTLYGRVQIADEDMVSQGGLPVISEGDMIFHVYNDILTEQGIDVVRGDFLYFREKYYEVIHHGPDLSANPTRLGIDRKFYRMILAHTTDTVIFSGT